MVGRVYLIAQGLTGALGVAHPRSLVREVWQRAPPPNETLAVAAAAAAVMAVAVAAAVAAGWYFEV